MNSVNKTLYIPLYGKAYVSRKGIILRDKKAEEIWNDVSFPLKGKSKSKWLAYYMGIRSAVFDDWLRKQMTDREDAVVIHIGCGLDSRMLRVGTMGHKWYDVDFVQVIEERSRYYTESDDYKMIGADVRDNGWLKDIAETGSAIVVMEGVSMYMDIAELKSLTERLSAHFEKTALLMDCYTVLAAKMSKYKNPVKEVGVTKVYGLDVPELLESGKLAFVKEHEMTPMGYIEQLSGAEKSIFEKLYAGKMAKKLYKMFEYG